MSEVAETVGVQEVPLGPVEVAPETPPEAKKELTEEEIQKLGPKEKIAYIMENAYQKYTQNSGRVNSQVEVQDIRLYSTHVETIVNNITKAISLADFREILNNLLSIEESKIPAFSLPYGCFSLGLRGNSMQLSCYYPSTMRKLIYNTGTKKTYDVMFPNTIISHTLQKQDKYWNVTDTKYFCTPKTVNQLPETFINQTSRSGEIFSLPVSNMYEDGRMCYGNNTMPRNFTQNLRGLDYFYQILFDSPFNNDLGVRALGRSDPGAWFQEWSKLTSFPYDLLRNSR